MKFCPTCRYYLYLDTQQSNTLRRVCKNCGFTETDEKGGLILETYIQERSNEGYKILVNEFTRQDPTLPHTKNVQCPKGDCPSNSGAAERDVIYQNYNYDGMKYIYICNVCDQRWRTK